MNVTEIKKELYKTKVMAKFAYYISGNLYYTVDLFGKTYKFPIATVEDKIEYTVADDGGDENEFEYIELSKDLGTTEFHPEVRGSELARWIQMAVDSKEFLEVI